MSGTDEQILFGQLTPRILTLTVQQLVVLAPQLTFQLRAQLLTSEGRYGPFYEATREGAAPIHFKNLRPISSVGDPSFHAAALNVNAVLRWEYRLGSTLYAVYTRSQEEPFTSQARGLGLGELASGTQAGTLMLKASYAW